MADAAVGDVGLSDGGGKSADGGDSDAAGTGIDPTSDHIASGTERKGRCPEPERVWAPPAGLYAALYAGRNQCQNTAMMMFASVSPPIAK